jgi:ABC-2 type transport system permease protein
MWVFGQFIAEAFGGWVVSFSLFSIPLFAISPLLGVNPLPASASAGIWFIVSLLLAVTIGFAIDFIFSAVVVLMQYNQYGVTRMREAITVLLSGAILPLALMPWGLGEIFGWLPFASMASAPLRIYTGTGDPVTLIPIQIMWVIVTWPAALLLWRSQRENLVSYGG